MDSIDVLSWWMALMTWVNGWHWWPEIMDGIDDLSWWMPLMTWIDGWHWWSALSRSNDVIHAWMCSIVIYVIYIYIQIFIGILTYLYSLTSSNINKVVFYGYFLSVWYVILWINAVTKLCGIILPLIFTAGSLPSFAELF